MEKFDKCLDYLRENCVRLTDLEIYYNMINNEKIKDIPKEDYGLVISLIDDVWLDADTNSISNCAEAVIENWEEIQEKCMTTYEIIDNYII